MAESNSVEIYLLFVMMHRMKRTLISLFIAASLLLTPVVHAADIGCQDDVGQMSDNGKVSADSKQQSDGKMANAGHHCCCPHVSSIPNLAVAEPMKVSSRTIFALEQDATASVVVGPPLKPPSHV